MYACMHIYIYIYMCIYMYIHTYIYIYIYIHIIHTQTNIHTRITYTHTHIHTHAYIRHAQVIDGAEVFSRDASARQLAASGVAAMMRTSVEKVEAESVTLKVVCVYACMHVCTRVRMHVYVMCVSLDTN